MTSRLVLVVEDNPSTRKLARVALEAEGLDVADAPDAAAALRLASERPPDLVLQDITLPDMDGFDLCARLRALPGFAEVPILAFSGLVSVASQARASAAGFTGFLVKPVEPSLLVATVRAHLPAAEPAVRPGAGRRVLVVDDDRVQLELARVRLEGLGFDVATAWNGRAALEIARARPPDAVLSDVLMPEMDGFSLCEAIREDPVLGRVPVVLATSNYVEEADRELGRRVGSSAYVVRSPALGEVVEALLAALDTVPPPAGADSSRPLRAEHVDRVLRQLERQAAMNAGLAQRAAIQAAELSVLSGISQALCARTDTHLALDQVLASCLDACGISLGILYLLAPDGTLRVRAVAGWPASNGELAGFFGHEEFLRRAIAGAETVVVPSSSGSADVARDLAEGAGIETALVAPIAAGGQPLGALVVASREKEAPTEDWALFARTVANQVGQALALSRAFARVAASERRYRALFESATDAVLVVDLHGRFVEVNAPAAEIWGAPPEELAGASFRDLATPATVEMYELLFRKLLAEGAARAEDLPILRRDGRAAFVDATATLVRTGGPPLVLVVARDVTDRNRIRQQAMQTERLAAVGTLAAGIAHEINNPTAYVHANLSWLREKLDAIRSALDGARAGPEGERAETLAREVGLDALLHESDEVLRESVQGAERIRDIVRDLRAFSRIDEEEVGPVGLHEVLDGALRLAWTEVRHRARLEKDYGRDVPEIQGSAGRLGQVFLNLIVNAAQAMDEGKADDNRIRIATRVEGDRVRVDVTDTGRGIPPDVLPRIFDPFFTTKPVGVGTGLGLAICHDLVRKHDGTIEVESVLGRGTTFTVLLPLQAARPSPAPEEPPAPSLRRCRVLLVDDEPFMLRAYQRVLGARHDVVPALGGRAAVEAISTAKQPFDAILCDLMMPDVDGVDLHRWVCERRPGLERRMIFVTGGAFTDRTRAFLDGVPNPRVGKPFRPADLERALAEVVGS